MKRILSAVCVAFFLAAGPASANIIYTFSGVTFDDGGTLTGTFTTDNGITALLDFNVTTSAGTGIGFTYTTVTAGSGSTSLPFILVLSTPTLDNILEVTFSGGLTALGATITIGTNDSFEQTLTARRDITAGSVIVARVPEPWTIALVGIGLLGLLAARRRRHA